MLAHRFAITYLPQKFEEHHQPTERSDRSLSLAQFHFFSAPKRGKFPVHCFVLLGVSFNQLKLNRDRAKQCYLISEFRLSEETISVRQPKRTLAVGMGVHRSRYRTSARGLVWLA